MKGTEWMGRYRQLVLELSRHANQSFRFMTDRHLKENSDFPCAQVWQVLEYIVEHPEGMDNMRIIADELGISKSSLTKYTHELCKLGYIRKYKSSDNKKNIILRATEEGVMFYAQGVEKLMRPVFESLFRELDAIPQKYLDVFVTALTHHNQHRTVPPNMKLVAVDDHKGPAK